MRAALSNLSGSSGQVVQPPGICEGCIYFYSLNNYNDKLIIYCSHMFQLFF